MAVCTVACLVLRSLEQNHCDRQCSEHVMAACHACVEVVKSAISEPLSVASARGQVRDGGYAMVSPRA
jgi:hypothetical protein